MRGPRVSVWRKPELSDIPFRFVASLDAELADFYPAVPYPGTAMRTQLLARDLVTSSDWRKYHYGDCVVKTPDLGPREILGLVRKAYRQFYVRPGRWLSQLRRWGGVGAWRRLVGLGLGILLSR